MTTKKSLLIAIITTSLIVFSLYGFMIEPHKFRNNALASMFKELKIAKLGDLHLGTNKSISTKRTIGILNNSKLDLILYNGR